MNKVEDEMRIHRFIKLLKELLSVVACRMGNCSEPLKKTDFQLVSADVRVT